MKLRRLLPRRRKRFATLNSSSKDRRQQHVIITSVGQTGSAATAAQTFAISILAILTTCHNGDICVAIGWAGKVGRRPTLERGEDGVNVSYLF